MDDREGDVVGGIEAAGLRDEVPGRVLLDDLSLVVRNGRSVAIMGPSGSGKTSLLNVLAGIRRAQASRLVVAGRDLLALDEGARAQHRLTRLGMVFQHAELLSELTVQENVSLPLRLQGRSKADAGEIADTWLARVGLAGSGPRRPSSLSGGEAQRAAVARALCTEPRVVLADEPTGSLDASTGMGVAKLLFAVAAEEGVAVLVATHDSAVASTADEVLLLRAGQLRRRPDRRSLGAG